MPKHSSSTIEQTTTIHSISTTNEPTTTNPKFASTTTEEVTTSKPTTTTPKHASSTIEKTTINHPTTTMSTSKEFTTTRPKPTTTTIEETTTIRPTTTMPTSKEPTTTKSKPASTTIEETTTIRPTTTISTSTETATTKPKPITTTIEQTTTVRPTTIMPTSTEPATTKPKTVTTTIEEITTIRPTTILSTTKESTTTKHQPALTTPEETTTTTFKPATSTKEVQITSTAKELVTSTASIFPSTSSQSTCCCPQNGVWSSWSAINECNDTCGSCGQITYTRTCLSSATCPCSGPTTKSENCNLTPCNFPRAPCCGTYTVLANATTIICGPQPTPSPEPPSPTCASCTGSTMEPVWTDWSEWSACMGASCGQCGTSTRTRTCALSECGCRCAGNATETKQCTVSGTWSAWTQTASCNGTCGGCGVIVYNRNCNKSSGCSCYGSSTKTEICALSPCTFPNAPCCNSMSVGAKNGSIVCGPIPTPTPEPYPTCTPTTCCPTDGIWSEWSSPTTSCNDTCGMFGVQTISRTCLSNSYGCACTGSSTQQEKCGAPPCTFPRGACYTGYSRAAVNHTFICVPTTAFTPSPTPAQTTCCPPDRNGLWNSWGAWSQCSVTCGGGSQTRTRSCASSPYGCPCNGSSTDQQSCNTVSCISCTPDGTWSAWSTGTCNDTCGMCGSMTNTRTCLSEAQSCPCTGSTSISVSCGQQVCFFPRAACCKPYSQMVANGTFVCGIPPTTTTSTTTTTTIPCPVGGIWSAWGSASCSDTCGLCGSSVQSRTCLSQSSGCPCSGLTTQSIGYCAPIVCTFPRAACCSWATRQVVNSTFQCVQTSG